MLCLNKVIAFFLKKTLIGLGNAYDSRKVLYYNELQVKVVELLLVPYIGRVSKLAFLDFLR